MHSYLRLSIGLVMAMSAACVDGGAAAPDGGADPSAAALTGVPTTNARNVVVIAIGGQRRPGVLLDGKRALFDLTGVPAATAASALTVTYRSGATTQTRTGLHLDRHPFDARFGIVQVYPPLPGIPALVIADPAAPAEGWGACVVATATGVSEATGSWGPWGTPPRLLFTAQSTVAFQDLDVGVPCFRTDGALLGLVTGLGPEPIDHHREPIDAGPLPPTISEGAWLAPVAPVRGWITSTGNLARVRELRAAGSLWIEGPISFVTTPIAGTDLCMDLPSGSDRPQTAINQYSCHGGRAQQFYLEWDVDFRAFHAISGASGLCFDVTGASTTSGAGLQQYGCSGQRNQSWRVDGARHLIADHATSLCASARTGTSATTSGLPLTDRTCLASGDTHQRWTRRVVSP